MIINIPVEALCDGCRHCPRLDVRSDDIVLCADGRGVRERSYECAHINDCLWVREALAWTGGQKEEGKT